MATANDIIKRALRQINVLAVSESPSGDESASALSTLNDMLASWANDQLMTYQRVNRSKALTSGTGQYTIGSGGDWNTTRPLRIAKAFVRDSNGYDTELGILNNDQWSRVWDKDLESTYPVYLYYRPNYPLGEINVWPEPGTGITLHIEVWDQFTAFSALTTTVSLPPGYERMLSLGLALELAAEYHPPQRITAYIMDRFNNAKEYVQDVNNTNLPEMEVDLVNRPRRGLVRGEFYY